VSLSKSQFIVNSKIKKIKNSLSTGKKAKSIHNSNLSNTKLKKETPLCICPKSKKEKIAKKASFTLEAAVVIPVLACFLVSILFFFRVLEMQLDVEKALQYSGRQAAVTAFESKLQDSNVLLAQASALFQKSLKEDNYPKQYTSMNMVILNYFESSVKGDYIDLYASYQMQLPFGMFGNKKLALEQRAKTRKWTGFHKAEENDKTDSWVYITDTGSVYHTSKECTYLNLSIHATTKQEIVTARNKNGGKYHKCDLCKVFGNRLFITDYGDTYHSSLECPGLKRTIYETRLSQLEDYRPCSRCTKGEE